MNSSTQAAAQYFVRSEGKAVVGPFAMDQLRHLFRGGRLTVYAEVSSDRKQWRPISTLGEEFCPPQGSGPLIGSSASPSALPPDTTVLADDANIAVGFLPSGIDLNDDLQCFCMINGRKNGPLPLGAVKELARRGSVSPHDRLWIAGTQQWVEVGSVPDFTFPTQGQKLSQWLRKSPVMVTILGLAVLLLVVAPVVLVFGLARYRSLESQRVVDEERDDRAKQEQRKTERIAQLEREKEELIGEQLQLLEQRDRLESQLAKYSATNRIDEIRIQSDRERLREEIDDMIRKLREIGIDLAAKKEEVKAAREDLLNFLDGKTEEVKTEEVDEKPAGAELEDEV